MSEDWQLVFIFYLHKYTEYVYTHMHIHIGHTYTHTHTCCTHMYAYTLHLTCWYPKTIIFWAFPSLCHCQLIFVLFCNLYFLNLILFKNTMGEYYNVWEMAPTKDQDDHYLVSFCLGLLIPCGCIKMTFWEVQITNPEFLTILDSRNLRLRFWHSWVLWGFSP